jgi:Family of unknown function (DUF6338)
MVVPTTAYGVIVLVLLVLPGIVYAAVRTAVQGYRWQDRDVTSRVLQALLVSALLDTIYLLVLGDTAVRLVTPGPEGAVQTNPRLAAGLGLLLLGVIPALLAYFVHGRTRLQPVNAPGLRWLRVPRARLRYSPVPTAWDNAAPAQGGNWVRIRIGDGKWVGGWYSNNSFISTYPEPRDIYIEDQHHIGARGQFGEMVEGSAGIWVALRDGDIVEWVRP